MVVRLIFGGAGELLVGGGVASGITLLVGGHGLA